MWHSWAHLKKIDIPQTREEVLLQVLWYNEEILRKGQPWISKNLSEAGINRVQDIYNETTSTFLTYQQCCERFDVQINIMDFNSILVATPRSYKQVLNARVHAPVRPSFRTVVLSKRNPSKFLSKLALSLIQDNDACQTVWSHDVGCAIEDGDWEKIMIDVHILTNLDYLRWFQYRIVHRLLTTNVKRNKYDSLISNRCEFCKEKAETPIHLLVECVTTERFWNAWKRWMLYFFKIQIDLSSEVIIFNTYVGQQKPLINTMILIAKQHIYSSKCNKAKPNFSIYLQKVAEICSIEKMVALRNDKYVKHEKKWNLYLKI